MRKVPDAILLDFVAPVHEARGLGAALLALGLAAALGVGMAFERKLGERDRLEALVAASVPPHRSARGAESGKAAKETAAVARELEVPWTRLLAELETASHDAASTVSILAVEPVPGKQLVRITAEVRALPDALDFLERLQKSAVLRFPMLESHERRKDDPQHPLRVKLSAEWRS